MIKNWISFGLIAVVMALFVSIQPNRCAAQDTPKDPVPKKQKSFFLIGNSLTWDTVPPKLDGDTQWHVDCGKSLPFIVQNPEKPCVKTSTLWPTALKEKQYDVISLQVHYGSSMTEDIEAISKLIALQPKATVVVHTGWARSAERTSEWQLKTVVPSSKMTHNKGWIEELLRRLRDKHPDRTFRRTRAMDMLQQVEADIRDSKAPIDRVEDLYRDKIHMNVVTGRYLMHNAMRAGLGQPRSAVGFEKLDAKMKQWLDSILDRVLTQ